METVTSVKVDPACVFGAETLVPAADYVVHSDRGVIQSVGGPFLPRDRAGLVNADVRDWTRGPRVVQVVYATATSQVPADVKEAYARLVGHWYRQVKTEVASNFQNVQPAEVRRHVRDLRRADSAGRAPGRRGGAAGPVPRPVGVVSVRGQIE